jgi:hypothetical protein
VSSRTCRCAPAHRPYAHSPACQQAAGRFSRCG